jgi:hypothetical protein
MQNTARETQPVLFSDVEQAIYCNPKRGLKLDAIVCVQPILSTADSISWMPKGWVYAKSDFCASPISMALMATDPLYEISAKNTKRSLEKDAATELALEFDALYSKYNGRTRGWIKTTLNTELSKWASGATDAPFDWTSLLEKKKVLSALLDIICVKYAIRIAVWWSEHKKLTIWPLQESDDEAWANAPILNVEVLSSGEAHVILNPEGDARVKPSIWATLFKTIGEWQWVRPGTSPGLSTKTLGELRADYAEIAGENMASVLPKKIDKDTLSNIIYRHDWMNVRLLSC